MRYLILIALITACGVDPEAVELAEAETIEKEETKPEIAPEVVDDPVVATNRVETPKTLMIPEEEVTEEEEEVVEEVAEEIPDTLIYDETNDIYWIKARTGLDRFDANICEDLDFEGHTDWRLPTLEEFNTFRDEIYLNNLMIFGFAENGAGFWTSTINEVNDYAYYSRLSIENYAGADTTQATTMNIRCVR